MPPTVTEMKYGISRTLDISYEDAVAKTKAALKEQGFGVLSEIDIRAAMKEKLDIDVPKHIILGACNPPLAHQALTAEPSISLLLPCNVTVRDVGGKTEVAMIDANQMMGFVGNPALEPVAKQANEKLREALEAL
ncbi:MAG: DUF302 domain-containing protein [Thermoanaerobaculia bacterium]